jgi:H+/Cl- antiporter ClcA
LDAAQRLAQARPTPRLVTGRVFLMSALALGLGLAAAAVARGLGLLIAVVTNLSFYGRLSLAEASPADNGLGLWVILVPVAGAIVVGLMARYGSTAIRGHGIPEAMERVLFHRSRIPARLTLLKPLSAAVAIGTGGPFGAEGPIIATGGALGSLLGQVLAVTADERKTLLASGAAAGMAATFGAPISAVLLAIELLLFEYRPRSVIPVALASVMASGARMLLVGAAPMFGAETMPAPTAGALAVYVLLGMLMGVAAVGVTRLVYGIEDAFERLPIHWMWWPALGAVVGGVVGLVAPHTLGVGYDNIAGIVDGRLAGGTLAILCVAKLVSWAVALGSGTSGGTLAPLFTIGGAMGALVGAGVSALVPAIGVDVRVAGLVGMAALFAGASRALLTSVVFVFETTQQPTVLLPLLGGCATAYLVSCRLMSHSIMTEKIARRGVRVTGEYAADFLDRILVADAATAPVVSLRDDVRVADVRAQLAAGTLPDHQGFPVCDDSGALLGIVTRRDLFDPKRPHDAPVRALLRRASIVIHPDSSLREAADAMVRADVGRLPVVARTSPNRVVAIITRSDLLAAHASRLDETHTVEAARGGRAVNA